MEQSHRDCRALVMSLHRALTKGSGDNARPVNVHTGLEDGGAVYGTNEEYVQTRSFA